MTPDLIFDIGANNGDDTRYYLAKGFRVVAVEADPVLADALKVMFADQIASGALIVENVGVAAAAGELDFLVNSHNEWSSFVKNGKATKENTHEKITVPTIPMADLLIRHGTPYYLKIDIEGFEKPAIGTLNAQMDLLPYLSFEINGDWRDISTMLVGIGYSDFAVVRQGRDIHPDAPVPALEGTYVAQKFTPSMSGSFGREVSALWMPLERLEAGVADETAFSRARREAGGRPVWHDIHCRLG